MRAVDYVTHGFGGPVQVAASPDVLSIIRRGLPDAPSPVINAAIETYYRFGAAGFIRTAQFVSALERSDDAFVRLFPNIDPTRVSGAKLKQVFNGFLNTAASQAGLTPLSSIFAKTYRELLQEIPDNYPNAIGWWRQRISPTIPRWLINGPALRDLAQSLP